MWIKKAVAQALLAVLPHYQFRFGRWGTEGGVVRVWRGREKYLGEWKRSRAPERWERFGKDSPEGRAYIKDVVAEVNAFFAQRMPGWHKRLVSWKIGRQE